jgi:hypothetical protein
VCWNIHIYNIVVIVVVVLVTMQGKGVTNFAVDRPSYDYTTATTEFDDELIKRGIVTMEQVMVAKGATPEQATTLANQIKTTKEQKYTYTTNGSWSTPPQPNKDDEDDDDGSFQHEGDEHDTDGVDLVTSTQHQHKKDGDDHYDDDSFDDDDDIETKMFMQKYKQERLKQLQSEYNVRSNYPHNNNNTSTIPMEHIVREDWNRKVNDASRKHNTWIIVTLIESTGSRRDRVVEELHRLAREHSNNCNDTTTTTRLRLVTIDAVDAIPNWPTHRVPAMFAYRDGIKRHEWIASRQGEFPGRDLLGELFQKWGALLK